MENSDVLKIEYLLVDCPLCWQNFINHIASINEFDAFERPNFKKLVEAEGINNHNSIMNDKEISRHIKFNSTEELIAFKLKWG